jgi:hypothetical protein
MQDIPPQCQSLADEIDALEQEIRDLQDELQFAPTGQKAFLVGQPPRLSKLRAARQGRIGTGLRRWMIAGRLR